MMWKELIVGKQVSYDWYPDSINILAKPRLIEGIIVDATLNNSNSAQLKILNSSGGLITLFHFEVKENFIELLYGDNRRQSEIAYDGFRHKFPLIPPLVGDYLNPTFGCKRFPTTRITDVQGQKLRFENNFVWFSLKDINIPRIPYSERLTF